MLKSLYPWSPDALSRESLLSLVAAAAQLERAAQAGSALPQPLRGKRLALLADDHASVAAKTFVQAATELGAHVAHVKASADEGPRRNAELLGRLYDAIECQGLPAAEVRRLGRDAGVPVFDGIGDSTLRLCGTGEAPSPCQPLRLLQALLTDTLV